jgi:aminopeptidase N
LGSPRTARCTALLLAWLAALPAAGAPQPPSFEEHLELLRSEARGGIVDPSMHWPRLHDARDDYDVLGYQIDLELFPDQRSLGGAVTIMFRNVTPTRLSSVMLDLDSEMRVTSVGPGAASFQQFAESVRVGLSPFIDPGQTAAVTIRYSGAPRQDGSVGLVFSTHGSGADIAPSIYALNEPFHAHRWWPCKDRPDDKATVTLNVTVPDTLTVVGNGRLLGVGPAGAGLRRWRWHEDAPIATYLVAIAVSDYDSFTTTYVSPVDGTTQVPLTGWAWPDQLDAARTRWAVLPDIMASFALQFGEYPFYDEKYDQVIVEPPAGTNPLVAMENQTASVFGSRYLLSDREDVQAHELAHQWWGDLVTPAGFDDIWLNEGFATWSEALWYESRYQTADYLAYMRELDPLRAQGEFVGTVDNPTDADGDGWPDGDGSGPVVTVYFKGAWIMHMLRWVLSASSSPGEMDHVAELLRAHAIARSGGNATTEQFVSLANAMAVQRFGMQDGVRWFFDEWLHRTDRPCYAVGWSAAPRAAGGYEVFVEVEQRAYAWDADLEQMTCTEPLQQPFRMPVRIRRHEAGGVTREEIVDNSEVRATYRFVDSQPPTRVTWDEEGWILKVVRPVDIDWDDDGWPDDVDGCWLVANPLQEDTDDDGVQDACESQLDWDHDGVVNSLDCAPGDPSVQHGPDPARNPEFDPMLHVRKDGDGVLLSWRLPPSIANQPPTVVDVMHGRLERLQANRGFDDARCDIAGTTTDALGLQASQVDGDRWFVATPWNGCGEVDARSLPISPCR